MIFRLNIDTGPPLYQQIVDQVKRMIACGTLQTGDRMPTVRQLASDLIVNPNTVARAYLELEREQVIETRRGLGSFVRTPQDRLTVNERRRVVAVGLDKAIVDAHHVGMTASEIRGLLDERLSAIGALEETANAK